MAPFRPRHMIPTLLALCLTSTVPARAEIRFASTEDGPYGAMFAARLTGEITAADAEALSAQFEQASLANMRQMQLDSFGGDLDAAFAIGRLMRSHQCDSLVLPDGQCDSACVFVLAAGIDKVVKGNVGKRGATLVIEGVAQAVGAGMHPQLGKSPDQLSPDLSRTMAGELLREGKAAIYSAYGILPGLQNPATTGPMVREAQRHLAQLILQPIAGMMAEEATDKLGGKVTLDVVRPMQAFDAGGKARALSTMLQALAQAKEAGIEGAALQDALAFIDWADE